MMASLGCDQGPFYLILVKPRVGLTRSLGFCSLPFSESSQGDWLSGESSTESEYCFEECQVVFSTFTWKSFSLAWPSCCFLSAKGWMTGILLGPPKKTMKPEGRILFTCRLGLKLMLWRGPAASHNFLQLLDVR